MTKEKVLELLQSQAREFSEKEELLKSNHQERLSEYVCIWRLVNFKVQDLISTTLSSDAKKVLSDFECDLCNQVEYFRYEKIDCLFELYCVALDGFYKVRKLLSDYLL